MIAEARSFWEGPLGHFLVEGVPVITSILAVGFSVARKMGVYDTIMRNYPPHRHINSHILYPKGLEPDDK